MDELNFFYYSSLMKNSITNSFGIITIKIFEFYPIFIEFMCSPIRIKNYLNQSNIEYKSSIDNYKIQKKIYKYSLYYLFRTIRSDKGNYSILFLMIPIGLISLFFVYAYFLKKKMISPIKKKIILIYLLLYIILL